MAVDVNGDGGRNWFVIVSMLWNVKRSEAKCPEKKNIPRSGSLDKETLDGRIYRPLPRFTAGREKLVSGPRLQPHIATAAWPWLGTLYTSVLAPEPRSTTSKPQPSSSNFRDTPDRQCTVNIPLTSHYKVWLLRVPMISGPLALKAAREDQCLSPCNEPPANLLHQLRET